MTTLYWILEYGKVFLAYMFIMFVWPNVVFRKFLKGKKPFYNFAFCSTIQIVIVSTIVLMLGLFHLLNPWTFNIIFYGIFLFNIFKNLRIDKKTRKKVKYLFTGTYGLRTFLKDVHKFILKQIKRCINSIKAVMHTHWWEYGILALVVIYGMIYFTYGAFQDYSYGFGDMYPHNAWIYGLINGQIFSAGVYPEGMHCFIYAMHTLFGIRVYSCLLFTAGIHISVFLLSAYIFLRQIFRWKYTPVIALTLFLTVDALCINSIYSMSRLQWTIPQDFGLYTQFICAAFLVRYLYNEQKKKKKNKVKNDKSISKKGQERTKEQAELLKKQKKKDAELLKQQKAEEARKAKEEKALLRIQKEEEKELRKKQTKEEKLRIKAEKAEQKKIKKSNAGGFSMPQGIVAYPQMDEDEEAVTAETAYAENQPEKEEQAAAVPEEQQEEYSEVLEYIDAEIVEEEQSVVYSEEDVQYEVNYDENGEVSEGASENTSVKETKTSKLENEEISRFKAFIIRVKKTWAYKLLERVWKDENLLVFTSALAASLVIHFYPTIMAFFLCLAFVPLAIHKVFKPRRFMELVVSVIVGLIVAVTPMAGALLSGIEFQGSIGWAVSIIEGEDPEHTTTVDENATTEEDETTLEDLTGNIDDEISSSEEISGETDNPADDNSDSTEMSSDDSSGLISGDESETYNDNNQSGGGKSSSVGEKISSLMAKAQYVVMHLDEIIMEKADIVYRRAYVELYRKDRAGEIIISTGIALATWAVLKVFSVLISLIARIKKKRISMTYFDGYFALILCSVFFMMLYCAGALGLPSLIAGSRLCSVAQLLIVAVMVIPVDAVFTGIAAIIKKGIMNVVALFMVIGTYLMVYYSGNFHGYLYYELTRHNAAVMCTYAITEQLPENSYTIVSPVDELYQVIQYGFHEELVEFINNSTEKSYKIPTEYVFIFVEKRPIEYAQSHFFEGPDWLAHEKYADYYNSYVSQCPDITTSDISDEIAKLPFSKLPVSSKMYSNLETRTVLESRCYAWCQEFNNMYPNELKVYYEDDNFVCYYFRQNPFSLFELAIQDSL